MQVLRSRSTVDGKTKTTERVCLVPDGEVAPAANSMDAALGSQLSAGDSLSQAHMLTKADDATSASSSSSVASGTSEALDDAASQSSAASDASDAIEEDAGALQEGTVIAATGAAVVSPGSCADCGQKCEKNWFECGPSLAHGRVTCQRFMHNTQVTLFRMLCTYLQLALFPINSGGCSR